MLKRIIAGIAVLLFTTSCTVPNLGTQSSLSEPNLSGNQQTPSPASSDTASPIDPWLGIKYPDPTIQDPPVTRGEPIFRKHGVGKLEAVITPDDETDEIQFYVACAPDSEYKVTMGKSFWSGCVKDFGNSGAIPLEGKSKELKVVLEIPDSTEYWILGFPIYR